MVWKTFNYLKKAMLSLFMKETYSQFFLTMIKIYLTKHNAILIKNEMDFFHKVFDCFKIPLSSLK